MGKMDWTSPNLTSNLQTLFLKTSNVIDVFYEGDPAFLVAPESLAAAFEVDVIESVMVPAEFCPQFFLEWFGCSGKLEF